MSHSLGVEYRHKWPEISQLGLAMAAVLPALGLDAHGRFWAFLDSYRKEFAMFHTHAFAKLESAPVRSLPTTEPRRKHKQKHVSLGP